MRLSSRNYVAGIGLGDRAATARTHEALADALRAMRRDGRIEGFLLRSLADRDDIADEDLEEPVILEKSGGKLPAVYVNITYATEGFDAAELRPLEERFDLRLFATADG